MELYKKYLSTRIDSVKRNISLSEKEVKKCLTKKKREEYESVLISLKLCLDRLKSAFLIGYFTSSVNTNICDVCGIEYNIPRESLVWTCPCCSSVFIKDKITITNRRNSHYVEIGDVGFDVEDSS